LLSPAGESGRLKRDGKSKREREREREMGEIGGMEKDERAAKFSACTWRRTSHHAVVQQQTTPFAFPRRIWAVLRNPLRRKGYSEYLGGFPTLARILKAPREILSRSVDEE